MLSHEVVIEGFVGRGRLLALDFSTRRMVVQWGDSVTAHASGYELRQRDYGDGTTRDEWHRFEVAQGWHVSVTRAAREGGRPLGECRDFDRIELHPVGPGLAPLRAWLQAEVVRIETDHRHRDAERRAIEPIGERYTNEQQERLRALEYDYELPALVARTFGSPGLLAIAGAFLLRLRRRLVHGNELFDLYNEHRVGVSGPADVDRLLQPLIALRLCRPYCYAPEPGTRVGESAYQPTAAEQRAFATRGVEPNGGFTFWYFTIGERFAELPYYTS